MYCALMFGRTDGSSGKRKEAPHISRSSELQCSLIFSLSIMQSLALSFFLLLLRGESSASFVKAGCRVGTLVALFSVSIHAVLSVISPLTIAPVIGIAAHRVSSLFDVLLVMPRSVQMISYAQLQHLSTAFGMAGLAHSRQHRGPRSSKKGNVSSSFSSSFL